MIGIQIIKNSIKRKLYDYKTLVMISLFPLLLTIIFVNVFSEIENINLGEIHLIIQSDNQVIGDAYASMLETLNEAEGVNIKSESISKDIDGAKILDEQKADFLICLKENPFKLEIIKGRGSSLEAMQIEGISQNYVRQFVLSELAGGMIPTAKEVWEYEKIEKEETVPIAIGMLVTMIVFGTLLGGQYGINQIFYIKEARGRRVVTAPIREVSLYVYELIASLLMLFVVTLGLTGIYNVLYDLGLEKNVLGVIGIIGALTVMAITLGVLIGMFVKSPAVGENLLSLVVIGVNFTSGGFTPGIDLGIVGKLSPIRGVVEVLTNMIIKGETQGTFGVVASIFGGCTALLLIAFGLLKIKKKGITYGKYIKVS